MAGGASPPFIPNNSRREGRRPVIGSSSNRQAHDEPRYVTVSTPVGWMLMTATSRGVCALAFGDDAESMEAEWQVDFPGGKRAQPDDAVQRWASVVVEYLNGGAPLPNLPLDVHASDFRLRVWNALKAIPAGERRTYSEVAAAIGAPGSARAVAGACASNRIALLIPCHRVVRSDGNLSGFRWGAERKKWLLSFEAGVMSSE